MITIQINKELNQTFIKKKSFLNLSKNLYCHYHIQIILVVKVQINKHRTHKRLINIPVALDL